MFTFRIFVFMHVYTVYEKMDSNMKSAPITSAPFSDQYEEVLFSVKLRTLIRSKNGVELNVVVVSNVLDVLGLTYTCLVCKKSFSNKPDKSALMRHMYGHSRREKNKVVSAGDNNKPFSKTKGIHFDETDETEVCDIGVDKSNAESDDIGKVHCETDFMERSTGIYDTGPVQCETNVTKRSIYDTDPVHGETDVMKIIIYDTGPVHCETDVPKSNIHDTGPVHCETDVVKRCIDDTGPVHCETDVTKRSTSIYDTDLVHCETDVTKRSIYDTGSFHCETNVVKRSIYDTVSFQCETDVTRRNIHDTGAVHCETPAIRSNLIDHIETDRNDRTDNDHASDEADNDEFNCEFEGAKYSIAHDHDYSSSMLSKKYEKHVYEMCEKTMGHTITHNEKLVYVCRECGCRFKKINILEDHCYCKKHTDETVPCHVCGKCGELFPSAAGLKEHGSIHKEENPYLCTACGKQFRHKPSLNAHAAAAHGDKTPCTYCGKTFVRVHHEGKRYPCTICGRILKGPRSLKNHLKLHSNDEFSCSECGEKFNTKTDLGNHFRKHTGEKPYVCSYCDHAFRIRTSLVKHLQTVHGNHQQEMVFIPPSISDMNLKVDKLTGNLNFDKLTVIKIEDI